VKPLRDKLPKGQAVAVLPGSPLVRPAVKTFASFVEKFLRQGHCNDDKRPASAA
jgi:hypothetical protein